MNNLKIVISKSFSKRQIGQATNNWKAIEHSSKHVKDTVHANQAFVRIEQGSKQTQLQQNVKRSKQTQPRRNVKEIN